MKINFIGAAHEVTGSCHLLECAGKRILIDCGMEQGADIYENQHIPVKSSEIDYVFVTHAHIDHSGLLPLLFAEGFKGEIYATEATAGLCTIMLRDSAHIQEAEAEWKNRKALRSGQPKVTPLYSMQDAEGALSLFVPCPYGRKIKITDDIEIQFRDAGHLLGSSIIEIWIREEGQETKIVFSGDLGNGHRPLIKDPEYIKDADYLIIESTYGDRNHDVPSEYDYATALTEILKRTFTKGGNLIIPAFSVGRTQEMLYHLRRIKTEQMLPEFQNFEVYIDSPLAIEATTIFNNNVAECFRDECKEEIKNGVNPIQFPGLKTAVSSEDSVRINTIKEPVVIISASGMCEAGRIRHHLKHNLWRADSCVLFVGYQVPGTLGNKLLNGAEEVKIFGETIEVNAEIVNLPGISGHADRDHLTEWVSHFETKPKRTFVVHGEDIVTDHFAQHLHDTLGIEAVAPYSGDVYNLLTNAQEAAGTRKRVEKKSPKASAAASAFQALLAAGNRLLSIIRKNEGAPNKDLARFTSQIQSLCDKWDRND